MCVQGTYTCPAPLFSFTSSMHPCRNVYEYICMCVFVVIILQLIVQEKVIDPEISCRCQNQSAFVSFWFERRFEHTETPCRFMSDNLFLQNLRVSLCALIRQRLIHTICICTSKRLRRKSVCTLFMFVCKCTALVFVYMYIACFGGNVQTQGSVAKDCVYDLFSSLGLEEICNCTLKAVTFWQMQLTDKRIHECEIVCAAVDIICALIQARTGGDLSVYWICSIFFFSSKSSSIALLPIVPLSLTCDMGVGRVSC